MVWLSFFSCSQCGRKSKLISKFYELELNIQGHKQLSDCVTEFLKVRVGLCKFLLCVCVWVHMCISGVDRVLALWGSGPPPASCCFHMIWDLEEAHARPLISVATVTKNPRVLDWALVGHGRGTRWLCCLQAAPLATVSSEEAQGSPHSRCLLGFSCRVGCASSSLESVWLKRGPRGSSLKGESASLHAQHLRQCHGGILRHWGGGTTLAASH